MAEGKVGIILVEDQIIFRQGLRLLLQATSEVEVVGEADSGAEGLRLLEATAGRVDVLISDLILPDISGLEVITRAKARIPALRTILLTQYTNPDHIDGMIAAGADGYVLKHVAVEELLAAIHAVMRGETALSPIVARQLMARLRDDRRRDPLSARERQVLALLARGLTSKEAAQDLKLSVNTIDNHRTRILSKLGVSNTAAAIRLAVRQGLIPPGDER